MAHIACSKVSMLRQSGNSGSAFATCLGTRYCTENCRMLTSSEGSDEGVGQRLQGKGLSARRTSLPPGQAQLCHCFLHDRQVGGCLHGKNTFCARKLTIFPCVEQHPELRLTAWSELLPLPAFLASAPSMPKLLLPLPQDLPFRDRVGWEVPEMPCHATLGSF